MTAEPIMGLYKNDYALWYYKGFAEFMLGMDEESEKSMYESNYLQETDASKNVLNILSMKKEGFQQLLAPRPQMKENLL